MFVHVIKYTQCFPYSQHSQSGFQRNSNVIEFVCKVLSFETLGYGLFKIRDYTLMQLLIVL